MKNLLTIISEPFYKNGKNNTNSKKFVTCECDCGNIKDIRRDEVGTTTFSCGCLINNKRKLNDLNNQLNDIIHLYIDKKLSCRKIALILNTTRQKVSKLLRENNIIDISYKVGKYNKGWKGTGDISKQYWNQIIHHAKIRNLEISITIEYVWNLFIKQNRKCALSGLDLNFAAFGHAEQTASLDRIDSIKGYIEGNVQWVHKDINIMKMDMNEYQFIKMCDLISRNKLRCANV